MDPDRRWLLECGPALLLGLALGSCSPAPNPAQPAAPDHRTVQLAHAAVGRLQANCWMVWDPDSGRGLVIDPGDQADMILSMARENSVTVTAIVHTHGHPDHVGATGPLLDQTPAVLYRHPDQIGPGADQAKREKYPGRIKDIIDGDTVRVGPFEFKVVHTPGHSPGGICLAGDGLLFTGDLLFKGSVGRTDLAGGDPVALLDSLRKLAEMFPDDIKVLPGHGPTTTLGAERKTNPYFPR